MKKILSILGIILLIASILMVIPSFCGNTSKLTGGELQEKVYVKTDESIFGETGSFTKCRAVSLKALQEMAKESMANGTCPKDILQLCGIKRVSGYVIDEKNKDLILIGEVDDTSPPLYLEDFVIALRNVWWIYAPLKGNTYYYSPPECSIDPDPAVFNNLQQISSQISSSSNPEEVQKYLNQWRSVCSQPQQVRVMGIPTDTRFAKVMVEADYYMKRLVDGSVTLDIPGFTSLMDMFLSIARRDIQEGKPVSVPLSFYRFWFSPGENSFLEDKGVVYLKKSEVRLLTEEELLTKSGERVGIGKPNPLADEFAKNFSARYTEIAKIKPIYSELEALFRFVSLAKIMKYRNAASEAGISLDYLLNHYPVKDTPVSRTLPGLSNIKEFRHEGKFFEAYLWLPSCGGVSIDINVKDSDIAVDSTGILLKEDVLKAKPSSDSLYWDFLSRLSEYEKIYQNIDKYPEMKNKRIFMFNQKDESTIQNTVIGQNLRKTEDVKISLTLKELFEKWDKADESTRHDYLTDKKYLGELLSFRKKIYDAAEGNEIILDAPQFRDSVGFLDILNLCFAGNIMIPTKHAVPEAIAKTLNWNKQVKFTRANVVVVYSANPDYSEAEQEERKNFWETKIEEINEDLVDKIELKIVDSPEEVFRATNEIKNEGVAVFRLSETGEDGYTILPNGGRFNDKDLETKVEDNPERVNVHGNCHSIKYGYPDACSKTGAGINIGTTREILDECLLEFLRLFTKRLEINDGNLLDAFQYAINERQNGQNYYFIISAQEYVEKNPGDLDGAIKYANDKIRGRPDKGCSGIQIVLDSRGI